MKDIKNIRKIVKVKRPEETKTDLYQVWYEGDNLQSGPSYLTKEEYNLRSYQSKLLQKNAVTPDVLLELEELIRKDEIIKTIRSLNEMFLMAYDSIDKENK